MRGRRLAENEWTNVVARPGFTHQFDTLLDRNMAILLGSFSTLLLLMAQPPLLGYVIGIAWQNSEAEPTTYFSMTIAVVYLGCMNACCMIVRERAVFDRERMFSLSVWAYLLSKIVLLAVIIGVQTVLLLAVQGRMMHLPPAFLDLAGIWLVLSFAGVCASGLGLLISACARTSYGAVVAVPSLIVPQIVFSKVVLQAHIDKQLPSMIQKVTITKWCYDGLDSLAFDGAWSTLLVALLVMLAQLMVFLLLSAMKLALDEGPA